MRERKPELPEPVAFGHGGLERATECIWTGIAWIGVTLIIYHSGPTMFELLLTWPTQILGGALIFAGIIDARMA